VSITRVARRDIWLWFVVAVLALWSLILLVLFGLRYL
jgi:hypothetical protein